MKWTTDQQKVIDLRNRNILVSAAAGSGKTAVLVQRIINIITDKENPVNIDRLLIVTFTKAAAAEMKERIALAIEKEIEKDVNNEHLQKQALLIYNAQITTIDSFCLNLVRNYFNEIELNPSFRIADENEIALLKTDIIKDTLEECFEEEDEKFTDFIRKYSDSKADNNIEDIILRLYTFSASFPWQEEWLSELLNSFQIKDYEDFSEKKWVKFIVNHVHNLVLDILNESKYLLKVCNGEGGPSTYGEALESDIRMYEYLLETEDIKTLGERFSVLEYAKLSRKKCECEEELKELVKNLRDEQKKKIKKIGEKFFRFTIDEYIEEINYVKDSMESLVNVTKRFIKNFKEAKRDRNIIDFSDMEHFALDILVKRDVVNGETVLSKTEVAKKLSDFYEEILVDEYQDSNNVQEAIINAISKEELHRPNVFMVGDVKQSIYKFRMAKPELFMEKFDSYSTEDSLYQRIDLKMNFRSRKVVLDGINYIFEKIMTRSFGKIEYDELAKLYEGATYYPNDNKDFSDSCELLFFDEKNIKEAVNEEEDVAEYSKIETEIRMIVKRIKELVDKEKGMLVYAKDRDGNMVTRRAEYKDIVILLRGLTDFSEPLVDIFSSAGIPFSIDSQTGYFSAIEVKIMLNMLRIINNPRNDIALTSVLLSPIGGFNSEEIANMRVNYPEGDIYEMIKKAADNGDEKVKDFFNMLNSYRDIVSVVPIHELIEKVMNETGYYTHVFAMPDGERRKMNLEMLVKKALKFEQTSYKGLFNFIRYMDRLNKYEIDSGEAMDVKNDDNYVRAMTIHKSKGLEFPIVFVAAMGKNFNFQDASDRILINADYGLAPDYIDGEYRLKSATLMKNAVSEVIKTENIAEELRILYVALTRAKEKLILTGRISDAKKLFYSYALGVAEDGKVPYAKLANCKNYFDFVIPALIRHKSFQKTLDKYGYKLEEGILTDSEWTIREFDIEETLVEEMDNQFNNNAQKVNIYMIDTEEIYDKKLYNALCEERDYVYSFNNELKIKVKKSVSELKKWQYEEGEEQEYIKRDETEVSGGALRGTLYHKVMELIDFSKITDIKSVANELERMAKTGHITEDDVKKIRWNDITKFAESSLYKRVLNAEMNGKVKKEQPFVIGFKAREVDNLDSDELVLVQGIIDLYFEENDDIILVDYKTDFVPDNNENILSEKYKIQLDYYAKALERITKKKVKEKIIYSFCLGKEIRL